MRLLLDTHTFLWWAFDQPQLSAQAAQALREPSNEVFFSAVTALEIAIKNRLGRDNVIHLDGDPADLVPLWVAEYGFITLPVEVSHALRVAALPPIHGDPFDRLLVAQAQIEGLTILTAGPAIAQYGVPVAW